MKCFAQRKVIFLCAKSHLWSIEGEAIVEEDVGEDELDQHEEDVEDLHVVMNKDIVMKKDRLNKTRKVRRTN